MKARPVDIFVTASLVAAALVVAAGVYGFSQGRFFTVDEYQYIHATWLVSQGERPYVDFYEHHFPLSYVLHAPLLWIEGTFPEKALLLRGAVWVFYMAVMAAVGVAAARVMRNSRAGLLAFILAVCFGFSLMSAIDYRADNWGAFLLLAGVALLETNRDRPGTRGKSFAGGILLALAVGMTQKMVFLAGGTAVVWIALDALATAKESRRPFLRFPVDFCAGFGLVVFGGFVVAAVAGLLEAGYEITIVQALRHEVFYPAVSGWTYFEPFLEAHPISTGLVVLFAGVFFALSRDSFWAVPLGVAVLGGVLVKAQYPYNYVFPCLVVAVVAARGFSLVIARIQARPGRPSAWASLLYLLPLAVAADQARFVAGVTSNDHQLAILEKIERFSSPEEVVIDNSGGALFRPHGSYYYHHGDAHREMFADYFRERLVEDYRDSGALLWIMDYRLLDLPPNVHDYFQRHYVRADGSLFGLGFHIPRTGDADHVVEIDVIREGRYHVFPAPVKLSAGLPRSTANETGAVLVVDGVPVTSSEVELGVGSHRVEVPANFPGHIISLLSPDAFLRSEAERFERELDGSRSYQLLFEYDRR